MLRYLLVSAVLICALPALSQQLSYSDPAVMYQRILLEKSGEGSYQKIGNFKVIGTSFLYGGNQRGNVYTPSEKAEDATISYDTYNQQILVMQKGQDKELAMSIRDVDSFTMNIIDKKVDLGLKFINAQQKDPSKKFFMAVISEGPRFNLYKVYTSTMGYVSTNYIQSELRQFDLLADYYYCDNSKKGLKKIRLSEKSVKSEFKDVADLTETLNSVSLEKNPEQALSEVFKVLNAK